MNAIYNIKYKNCIFNYSSLITFKLTYFDICKSCVTLKNYVVVDDNLITWKSKLFIIVNENKLSGGC